MTVTHEYDTSPIKSIPDFGPTVDATPVVPPPNDARQLDIFKDTSQTPPAASPIAAEVADGRLKNEEVPVATSTPPHEHIDVTQSSHEPPIEGHEEVEIPDGAREYEGILLQHGEERYKFDPNQSLNYFATIEHDDGTRETIWGKELKVAFEEGNFATGDNIVLANAGQVPVIVNSPVLDEQGKVVGYESLETHRNQWVVKAVEPTQDKAMEQATNVVEPSQKVVQVPESTLAALMKIANSVYANEATVDKATLANTNAALHHRDEAPSRATGVPQIVTNAAPQFSGGHEAAQAKSGAHSLVNGTLSVVGGAAGLVGGVAGLVGSIGSASGTALANLGRAIKGTPAPAAVTPLAERSSYVLPKLSEYRVDQVSKTVDDYSAAQQAFWNAGGMPNVRREIEERARVTGISVQDVMEKMKPGGEMADLSAKFNAAVASSPDAQSHKKAMDKALESWGRQQGRAEEEMLRPEQDGDPLHEGMKAKLTKARSTMEEKTADVPAFGNDPSHAERLREIVAKMVEKLKEFGAAIMNAFRGTREPESAPSP
jgi:hypothetical protein